MKKITIGQGRMNGTPIAPSKIILILSGIKITYDSGTIEVKSDAGLELDGIVEWQNDAGNWQIKNVEQGVKILTGVQ